MMQFFHYMFNPIGAPWYTGGFYGNQTQWTIVTLPSLVLLIWRMEKNHKRQIEQRSINHMIQMEKLDAIHKTIKEKK